MIAVPVDQTPVVQTCRITMSSKLFSPKVGVSSEELHLLPQPVFLPLRSEDEEIVDAEWMEDCEFDADDIPVLPSIAVIRIPMRYVKGGPLQFAPPNEDDWLVDE